MTNSSKSTVISVAVLSAIALVATALMVLLNALLPGAPPPSLGDRESQLLGEIMPGSEFFVYQDFDMADFNRQYGNRDHSVTMIVQAKGGNYNDNYAVRMSSKGFNDASNIDFLVAYDGSSAILGIAVVGAQESSPAGDIYDREGFSDAFANFGKDPNKPIQVGDITGSLGSGATVTARGIVDGVNIATKAAMLLNDVEIVTPPPPSGGLDDVQDILSQIMPGSEFHIDNSFDKDEFNAEFGNEDNNVTMIIKATGGTHNGNYIVRTLTQGYEGRNGPNPKLDILIGYNSDSAILGIAVHDGQETSPSGQIYDRDGFNDAFVSNGSNPNKPIETGDITDALGSGATVTANAIVGATNMATKAAIILNNTELVPESPAWNVPSDIQLLQLRKIVGDNQALFSAANAAYLKDLNLIPQDFEASKMVNAYIKRSGNGANETVILEAFGENGRYGQISLMVQITGQGESAIIDKVVLGSINSLQGRPQNPQWVDHMLKAAEGFDRETWYNGDTFEDDLDENGDIGSQATQTRNSFLLAGQHGFELHDVLNYAGLRDAVQNAPLPPIEWSVANPDEVATLRQMIVHKWVYNYDDPEVEGDGPGSNTATWVEDQDWIEYDAPMADFAKADPGILSYYDVYNTANINLQNIFVSMPITLTLGPGKGTSIDVQIPSYAFIQVVATRNSDTHRFIVMIDADKSEIVGVRLGFDGRMDHDADNAASITWNRYRPSINQELQKAFGGVVVGDITNTAPAIDISSIVDNNGVSITTDDSTTLGIANLQRNAATALTAAFAIAPELDLNQKFMDDATKVDWNSIDTHTLTMLRDFLPVVGSNPDNSKVNFKSADAKMLEKLGVIIPNLQGDTTKAEYYAMRDSIVNVFVALDGTGRIIVESFYNYNGNGEIASNYNTRGKISLLMMFGGDNVNRHVTKASLGRYDNTTHESGHGTEVQTAIKRVIEHALLGSTLRDFDGYFGDLSHDNQWMPTPENGGSGWLGSGATYAINGTLRAARMGFMIDIFMDKGILINQAVKV